MLHVAEGQYRRERGTACLPSRGTCPNGAETSVRTAVRDVKYQRQREREEREEASIEDSQS
jgi:hypothetical protein